ncbi:hypothetical protein GDO81_022422 [Engystomops pustulosus]|uniref:Uncharacterized protein n=1 Tax=Engystomops pustulosus TaxID=76066 RepID=A0AAV6ZAV9_ENGPU|nr:hypothetical protein GDO81_022422 [Engystomops pustulosus]
MKRGQRANIATTALHQHVQSHHPMAWEKHGSDVVVHPATAATAAEEPSGTHVISASQGSSTYAKGSYLSLTSYPSPDAPAPRYTWRQQSLKEEITKRQLYESSHPKEKKLTVLLSKLFVLQSLPFRGLCTLQKTNGLC